MAMLSEVQARKIATDWHSGQWSALYKISSCSDLARLTAVDWHEAFYEACKIRQYETRKTGDGHKLADWIRYRARKYGYIADAVEVSACVIR